MFGYSMYESIPMRRFERVSNDKLSTQRRSPQRDASRISRLRLGERSEAFANARRRVYDPMMEGQKDDLDDLRYSAMSVVADREARPKRAVAEPAAKASAADRRFYHPEGPNAAPVTSYGVPARVGVAALAAHNQMRDMMRFYKSLTVVPCVQRAVRREVLFATGAHGAHKGKRRKGPFSAIRC